MSKKVIEVKNISKFYRLNSTAHYQTLRDSLSGFLKINKKNHDSQKSFWALKNVSFDVSEGEILGVIGRNGAGKSTLLKILSKITPPTKGSAILHGRVGSLLEVGTGFHQELTGRENIFLNGSILGMKRREIKNKFDEIVDFSGVEKFLDMPVKFYSSGMGTRLAFSVAAFLEPEILLVDEVLSVGDAEFQKKSLGKIEDITKNEGRTVIFVSHNLSAVRSLTSKTILLDSGKIRKYGETDKVLDYYANKMVPEKRKTKISDRKDRTGRGDVKINDFWVEDENGKKVSKLITGLEYAFVLEYTRRKVSLKNVDFGFSVSRKTGEPIYLIYSSYLGKKYEKLDKKGRVRFVVPKLPLAGGEYEAGVRVVSLAGEEDYVGNAMGFSVENGDFYNSGSLIEQNHSPVFIEGYWK